MNNRIGYIFWRIVYPFSSIADGILGILSLTFYNSDLRYHTSLRMARAWMPKDIFDRAITDEPDPLEDAYNDQ